MPPRASARIAPFQFREVYFGLGLFFLISGFVIPLSFGKARPTVFLLRRLIRIYPVVIVTMLCTASVIVLGRLIDQHTPVLPLGFGEVLSNLFLVRDLFRHNYIDPGLWTLEVEMHFYLLCFVLGYVNGLQKASIILGVALGFVVFAYLGTHPPPPGTVAFVAVDVIAFNGGFITLMLVGTVIFNYFANGWSLRKSALLILLLLIANNYCVSNYRYFIGDIGTLMFSNHVGVTAFFLILFLVGDRLPYSRVIDKMANVSYPLYLLHGSLGYVVFFIVYKHTDSDRQTDRESRLRVERPEGACQARSDRRPGKGSRRGATANRKNRAEFAEGERALT